MIKQFCAFILSLALWPFAMLGRGTAWLLVQLWGGAKLGYNALMWLPRKLLQKQEPKRVGFVMPPVAKEEPKPKPKPAPKLKCGYSVEEIAAWITDEGEIPKQHELPTYDVPSSWEPSEGFDPDPAKVQIKSWTLGPAGFRGKRNPVKQNWTERLRLGQIRCEKKEE